MSGGKVNDIKIETEFKQLLPPLTPEQKEELEKDIIKNGCLNPLIVWGDILVDGHHRYEICTKNDIPYDILEMKFKDKLEAMKWAWANQKNRRNLNKYELAQIALKFKPAIEEKAKENLSLSGGDKKSKNAKSDCQKSDKAITPIDTKKELAKLAGVSHDTIHKVEYIEEKAPEDIKVKAKTGQLTINSAYNLTKDTIETKKKNEEAEKEYQQQLETEKLEQEEKKQQEEIKKSLPKNVVLLSKHEHQEKHIFGITDFNKMTGEQFDKCLDHTRKYQNVISKVAELSIDKDSLAAWNCTLEKQEEVFLELSTLEVAINNLTVIQNFFKGVKKHE
ncbi:ParB N-terminal domain-containing protein [Clostridium sp. DMHC 10]|uniref:ParB N-terminal domain-containing protein n=1 Tax=Clostridium sp. DMHC 10 TaxID=747377 RepID=UPI00325A65CC